MAYCRMCGAEVSGPYCSACGTPADAAAPQPGQPAPPQARAQAAAPPPPPLPPKRGTSPIVWVLIALLTLFILAGLTASAGMMVVSHRTGLSFGEIVHDPGYAAAKMAMIANPNLEEIEHAGGTITLRDRRTGKTATLRFGDVRRGGLRFSAEGDNGKIASFEAGADGARLPSWIPVYPGAEPSGGVAASGNSGSELAEGGTAVYTTSNPASSVISFYEGKAASMGVTVSVVTHGSNTDGLLVMKDENGELGLTVAASSHGGRTKISLTYGSKQ